jgi:hypothetical protein
MKNIRTGKIAVYDADLVEGGRWEEYFPPKEKPALKLKKLKGTGALEVAPAVDHDVREDGQEVIDEQAQRRQGCLVAGLLGVVQRERRTSLGDRNRLGYLLESDG